MSVLDSTKKVQKRNEQRIQILNKETLKIVDLLKSLIESSQISIDKKDEIILEKNMREGLQIQVNSSQLLISIESLLNLVQDLKESYLTEDFERQTFLSNEKSKEIEEKTKVGETLLKELKQEINEIIIELENHLLNSKYSIQHPSK